jgi:hypothetical protein
LGQNIAGRENLTCASFIGLAFFQGDLMWAVISVASVSAIQSTQATRLPANLDRRRARLVTERRPVLIAVRNVSGRRRWSKLQEWLRADVSKRGVSA